MKVQNISFTSEPKTTQKDSSFYNKKNYILMAKSANFFIGTALGFGVLESFDKFSLVNNIEGHSDTKLWKKAKNHTKWNILAGIGIGIVSTILGGYIDKKMLPKAEKLYELAEKQEAINKKAKELIEQEKTSKQTEKAE